MKYKLKKCKTRDEFFELTRDWYGVGLTFNGCLGRYEIVQKENWYSQKTKRDKEFGQYEGLKQILNSTFGKLYCGGVAGSHYGQYRPFGHRSKKRLEKLYKSTLSPKYQKIVHNYI